jgi:hypothetical protein
MNGLATFTKKTLLILLRRLYVGDMKLCPDCIAMATDNIG